MKRRGSTTEFTREAGKMVLLDGTPAKEESTQLGALE